MFGHVQQGVAMQKNLNWNMLLILAVLGFSVYSFVPPREKINLGLDLRGGIHMVLQVVTDEALNQELDQTADRIAQELKAKSFAFAGCKRVPGYSIEIAGVDTAQEKEVRQYVNTTYSREYAVRGTVVEGKNNYTLTLQGAVVRSLKETTVTQALETIRRRVDALGVSEPTLQIYGGGATDVPDQIIVELPGVDDPDRVKEIIK